MVTAAARVFAKVNYKEYVNGTYDGQSYSYVDHWASTSAGIVRDSMRS